MIQVSQFFSNCQLELITFEILAAKRLRLMRFDNRLIIDCFANVEQEEEVGQEQEQEALWWLVLGSIAIAGENNSCFVVKCKYNTIAQRVPVLTVSMSYSECYTYIQV